MQWGSRTSPINWAWVEPRIAALAQDGVRVLPLLFETPLWAVGGDCPAGPDSQRTKCPPANPQALADFARKVAQRYGPNGEFWNRPENAHLPQLPFREFEIWNVFKATRDALKAVDPSIQAIVGGLSTGGDVRGDDFLTRANLNPADVDGVAWHPYLSSATKTLQDVAAARRHMETIGLGAKPLHLTEWGYAREPYAGGGTGHPDPGLSPVARGAMFAGVASETSRSDCNIAQIHPHTWEAATLTSADWEDNHGPATQNATSWDLLPETEDFAGAMLARISGDPGHPRAAVHYCERPSPDRNGPPARPREAAAGAPPVVGASPRRPRRAMTSGRWRSLCLT